MKVSFIFAPPTEREDDSRRWGGTKAGRRNRQRDRGWKRIGKRVLFKKETRIAEKQPVTREEEERRRERKGKKKAEKKKR